MRTIDPPLINHAPRAGVEDTAAITNPSLDAPVNPYSDDIIDADCGGYHTRPADPISGSQTGARSFERIDRMRPAPPARALVTNPAANVLVKSEQALAHLDAQQQEREASDCLERFTRLLVYRHGVSNDAALALALAALSAAAGPGRTLQNPLGGSVSAALNVIVEDAVNARIRRAARQATRRIQQKVDAKVLSHQAAGAKHLRRLRMELEGDCARALHRLKYPGTKPPEPLSIPRPAEERAQEALSAAVAEAEPVAEAMRLHEFEERPFLFTDGLSAKDLGDLPRRSFDGALFNYSPGGNAIRELEAMPSAQRRGVLRFMVAAWHGESFPAGPDTIITPTLINLWLCDLGETARLGRNPAVAASGWLETVLAVANDSAEEEVPEESTATEVEDDWRKLIGVVLSDRIMGEVCDHQLSEAAAKRFLAFYADTIRCQPAHARKFRAWWPEQALKIALLLHLDTPHTEVPTEIGLATLEKAITLMERLGAAQLRAFQSSVLPQEDFDAQVEVMVAKVRIHGPLPKWNLFRRYHVQRAEVMEPVLARCCERNLLQMEGDLVRLADCGQ